MVFRSLILLVGPGTWSGTWSGIRCTGPSRRIRRGRLGVELGAEPGHKHRVIARTDGVQGVIPVDQELARFGVKAAPLRSTAARRQRPGSALGTPARRTPGHTPGAR